MRTYFFILLSETAHAHLTEDYVIVCMCAFGCVCAHAYVNGTTSFRNHFLCG